MEFKPKTSKISTRLSNARRHAALMRAIEADLLKKGATAQEIAQLSQCAGNPLAAAMAIALMVARVEDE